MPKGDATSFMFLRGEEGNELELAVVGYQFPDEARDPWDSNGLLVSVRVLALEGSWEVVDPCLTTWEATSLASWLAHAASASAGVVMRYAEPNLTLTARAGSRVDLRACFALERRPPWARMAAGSHNLCVDLGVERVDVARAAAALLDNLIAFPRRGNDPTL